MFTLPWHWTLRAVGLQHQSLTTESGYRNRALGAEPVGRGSADTRAPGPDGDRRGARRTRLRLARGGAARMPGPSCCRSRRSSSTTSSRRRSASRRSSSFCSRASARGAAGGSPRRACLPDFAIVVEFPLGVVALVLARVRGVPESGPLVGRRPTPPASSWASSRCSPTTRGRSAHRGRWGTRMPSRRPREQARRSSARTTRGSTASGCPTRGAALSLLVSEKGLLVVTPLVVAAAVGLPLQWRSGRRMETGVCAAIPALFLLYNAAYYLPFGGQGPGPRFLLPALPFLALPLAVALRARPLVVAGVGLVSVAVMLLATVTEPLTGVEYGIATWLDGLGSSALVETLLGRAGVASPWPGVVLVAMLVVAACALSLLRLPLRAAVRRDGLFLVGVLCAWLLLARASPGARSGGRRARDVRGRRGRRRPRSRTLGRLDPRVASQPGCAPPSDSRAGPRDPRTDDAPAVVAARLDARPRRRLGRLAEGAARARPFRRADTPRVGDTGETPRVAAVKALSVVSTSPPPPTHLIAAAIPGRGGRWMADLRDSLVAHAHCRADTVATEAKAATQRRVAQLIALRADGTTAMPRPQHAQDSRRLPDVRGHVWPAHDRAPMRAGILTRGHAGAPCAWQSAPRGRAGPRLSSGSFANCTRFPSGRAGSRFRERRAELTRLVLLGRAVKVIAMRLSSCYPCCRLLSNRASLVAWTLHLEDKRADADGVDRLPSSLRRTLSTRP